MRNAWNVKIVKKPELGIRIWLNKVVDLAGICSPISSGAFAHGVLLLRDWNQVIAWLSCRHTHTHSNSHTATSLVVFHVANSNRLLRWTIKLCVFYLTLSWFVRHLVAIRHTAIWLQCLAPSFVQRTSFHRLLHFLIHSFNSIASSRLRCCLSVSLSACVFINQMHIIVKASNGFFLNPPYCLHWYLHEH